SGIFRPGINAILGPTGCGKTTLLNLLAGQCSGQGVKGKVLINGQNIPSNFKHIAGYVIQDDMVMSMLTVKENVMFSANLRIHEPMTLKQKDNLVDETLQELGLTKCANTKIGNSFTRGISGGERKRTSIAMEIITSSRILFLDEPTSGLDASTAHSVMLTLKSLALKGMTVIMSIHQPRYSIFKIFDQLFVLSKGQTIFHGPANKTLDFLASSGYICEEHDNPSDFILDVLSGTYNNNNIINNVGFNISVDNNVADGKQLLDGNKYVNKKLQVASSDVKQLQAADDQDEGMFLLIACCIVVFFMLLAAVSCRTFKCTVRNTRAISTPAFSALILSLIVGSIYFQIDRSAHSARTKIQNRVGAFFFIVMNHVFANMSSVDVFIRERAIYIHETISGYYGIVVYFICKILFEVLPLRTMPIIFFSIITFFMIGFPFTLYNLLIYAFNIFLTNVAGASVALFFSASTRQHAIGTVLTSLVWVTMMVYSGVLVNIETVPRFLRWVCWGSIFRYSINMFLINSLKNQTFCDDGVSGNQTHIECLSGNEYLESQGIQYLSSFDQWKNEMFLIIISIIFLTLALIQLKRSVRFTQ
ncbi:hypothetical protein HELRODRAFT_82208, partial [Helobdella robusta]|uniref:ABC transporter domain-containing protein n=1 Tax=Helobdella robusta TaxID=6412 RepID=T1G4P2_HELRO